MGTAMPACCQSNRPEGMSHACTQRACRAVIDGPWVSSMRPSGAGMAMSPSPSTFSAGTRLASGQASPDFDSHHDRGFASSARLASRYPRVHRSVYTPSAAPVWAFHNTTAATAPLTPTTRLPSDVTVVATVFWKGDANRTGAVRSRRSQTSTPAWERATTTRLVPSANRNPTPAPT